MPANDYFLFFLSLQVKREGSKKVSGYLMFAAEARKIVAVENKGAPFGEISRLVGEKVSALSPS